MSLRYFARESKPGSFAAFFRLEDGTALFEHIHGAWLPTGHGREWLADQVAFGYLREIPAMPTSQIVRFAYDVQSAVFWPWLGDKTPLHVAVPDARDYFARCANDVRVVSHVAYAAPFAGSLVLRTRHRFDRLGLPERHEESRAMYRNIAAAKKALDATLAGAETPFEVASPLRAGPDRNWLIARCVEHSVALATERDEAEARKERERKERERKEREEREHAAQMERAAKERAERERAEREREQAARVARGDLTDVPDDDIAALLRKRREAAKKNTHKAGG